MRAILANVAFALALGLAGSLLLPAAARAHCDTMDGPVVTAAKTALEKGDVTPVLKWVKKDNEAEIREAFKKTVAVRSKGAEARGLADMYFFETVVRIHRAGEGAPYTGLKPAGTDVGPAVAACDKALDDASVDRVVKLGTDAVATGIRQRFAHAIEARKHADENVKAGREFVEAYVVFVHYVERLYEAARAAPSHPDEAAPAGHHEQTPPPS